MTDHPMIFSAPMVRALLDGRKTQTRRKTRLQPFIDNADLCRTIAMTSVRIRPGDRLWVRETWACHWATDNLPPRKITPDLWSVRYLADGQIRPAARDLSSAKPEQFHRYRSPIHMPRWASRLTLLVTDVRVQRVQEISEADARAEGVLWVPGYGEIQPADLWEGYSNYLNCREGFESLWNSIHGPDAWDRNDWVAAMTFTVEQRNIDQ